LCVIKTNQGASGWASLRGPRKEAESVAEELLGKKISDVFNVDQGVLANRYLPFDLALHDLAGVILEKPVYALLGHETPILTDYYSGMIYFDDLEPTNNPGGIERILEECRYDYEEGYRQFKIKLCRGLKWQSFENGISREYDV